MSEGLKEVSIEAIEDEGETDARSFDLRRLRYLRGMGFGMEGHENGSFVLVYAVVGELDA